MSAHTRSIEFRCHWPGCDRRATVEVFNTWNAPCGRYCGRHGNERVKELQAMEDAAR